MARYPGVGRNALVWGITPDCGFGTVAHADEDTAAAGLVHQRGEMWAWCLRRRRDTRVFYTTCMFDTLVDTSMLAAHLHDPLWVVVDCRFSLVDSAAGERAFADAHISGASYFHLDHDLAGPVTPASGRHPLPDPATLAAKLGRAGADADTQLVAYDDAMGAFAARLWWLTRWLGHPHTAVLDGGWRRWTAEGRPVTASVSPHRPRSFRYLPPDDRLWVNSTEIMALVNGHRSGRLLDARTPARFRGEVEPLDAVAGHIPGAVNLPYDENVEINGRFRSPQELRRRFEPLLAGMSVEQAVCMCGSGVTACHNLLAMEVAGLTGARLYAGSWSEWICDPQRPVARGE